MIFGDFKGEFRFRSFRFNTTRCHDEWIKVQASDNPSTKEEPRLSCSSRQPSMELKSKEGNLQPNYP